MKKLIVIMTLLMSFAAISAESPLRVLSNVSIQISELNRYVSNRAEWNDHSQFTLNNALRDVLEAKTNAIKEKLDDKSYVLDVIAKSDDIVLEMAELNRYLSDRAEWNGSAPYKFSRVLSAVENLKIAISSK